MARVGEFCSSNIARLVLRVVIVVGALMAAGVCMFYSSAAGHSLVEPQKAPAVK